MRPRHRRAAVLCLGLAAVALGGACAAEGDAGSTPSPGAPVALTDEARQVLERHLDERWQLGSGTVDGKGVEPVGTEPVTFRASRNPEGDLVIGGRVCNGFGLTVDGERMGDMVSTAMLCQDDVMAVENVIVLALPRVADAAVDGDTLTLSGEQVELIWTTTADADTD